MDRFARLWMSAFTGSLLSLTTAASASDVGRRPADWSGEARVQQATGLIKPSAAPVTPPVVKPNGFPLTAPVTCNDQNASSPACYTATQQGRPITR